MQIEGIEYCEKCIVGVLKENVEQIYFFHTHVSHVCDICGASEMILEVDDEDFETLKDYDKFFKFQKVEKEIDIRYDVD